MILVTGATGNVGSEVAANLAGKGRPVRALVRDTDEQGLPAGVEPVVGDLNRPETMRAALDGAEGVFVLPGYADMPGLMREIERAGARKVVQLSGGSAGNSDLSNAVTRMMAESETAARESGLAWTILRPASFTANALRWLPQLQAGDVVRAPFATVRNTSIDPYDVGAVAAVSLTEEGHDGEVYTLTGPDSMLPEEQVAILADVLGRALRFEAQPDDEAREEMLKTTPAQYVDAFFDFYVTGSLDESQVRPTVQTVTGRPPRTFRQWATAHAEAFR
ncbi:NAD(P)H-binding protein [Aeromicrobium sp. 9AM]|uniref:NAD(P)H-binding protein n=1 Tax=Aeromicrobium sp. 9AM TaxID=2653126 RepID=UPI0012F2A049|nr:NAD(P)H-binding protein [Aeromicrobium sp. 9AM]VXB01587.1 conserved hypothetical protein [Aeromicrobium sp. 9AM]